MLKRKIDDALKEWKKNNLEKELEPFIQEKYPDLITDPTQKKILELEKKLADEQKANARKDLITEAIKYAISQNVDVISMSLGGLDRDESMYSAIKDAIRRNISVVCAAGNDGDGDSKTEENNYPGAYNEVIEVGAIDKNYKITDFSNSNKNIVC